MIRGHNRIYRLDHALTKTQKTILNAFGIDAGYVKYRAGNLKIIAKDKGRESIQINGLKTLFTKSSFLSLSKFSKEYGIEYDKKSKVLKNFRLFVIMDTDDCSLETKEKYISGEFFLCSISSVIDL